MNDQRKTKKQLLGDLQRERERSELAEGRSLVLQEVSKRVAAAHDTGEVLDLIVNEATRLVGAHGAYIRMLEGDLLVPAATTESATAYSDRMIKDLQGIGVGIGATGRAMASKKPVVREDIFSLRTPEVERSNAESGLHGVAAIPLVANDRSIGVLAVIDTRERLISDDEVSLLSAFADQAAFALEKARLLHEAETERERADSLYRISILLAGARDTDEVLDLIVNEAARLVGTPIAIIRLLEGERLVASAATKAHANFVAGLPRTLNVAEGNNVLGHVTATKKPLFGEEAAKMLSLETRRLMEDLGFDPAAGASSP